MLDSIVAGSAYVMNIFTVAGQSWWNTISGQVPMLICLITFFNTIIAYVGQARLEKLGARLSKYSILSFTVLPLLISVCVPSVGGTVLAGKFLPEDQKIGYLDAKLSMVHPILGIFPHVQAPQLWVYMGIASGVMALGYDGSAFAIRALISALIMMPIRAYSTTFVYKLIKKRNSDKAAAAQA